MKHQPLLLPPQTKEHDLRSYVLRSGRLTIAQKRALNLHWAAFGLDLHNGVSDFKQAIAKKPYRTQTLEIGFGNGLSLLEQALCAPEHCFIGIEVHLPGVGQLLHRLAAEALTNVFIYHANALDVLACCIPDNCLDRVQINFPDPWPKKRHLKRRLVQSSSLADFLRVLKPGGALFLATDCADYAEQMAVAIESAQAEFNLSFSRPDAKPDFRPKTKFEQTAEKAGRKIHHFVVQKQALDLGTKAGQ